jgi:hypothetical protein
MTSQRRALAILAAIVVVAGCGSVSPPSPRPSASTPGGPSPTSARPSLPATPGPSPSIALDRVAGWSADIDAILDARDHVHPDGWHGMPRADWIAAADAAKAKLPSLTDDAALVALVRLAAMPGWSGRDGHSGIFLGRGSGVHPYPLRTWQFSDGLVVTAARAPYEDLVGSRITAIGGRPIADVMGLAEPLAPRDNPSNLLAFAPRYAGVSELLAGLGVIGEAGPATFSLVGRDGTAREATVEPVTVEEDVAWHGGQPLRLPPTEALWLARQDDAFWWTVLDESGTLYIQQNEVSGGIADETAKILARVEAGGITRVVLDLRNNGGGDNTTLLPLEDLLRNAAIDRPGRLFVLASRLTFSAAANLATDLEVETSAIFVGEAMGGSPNLYGDARAIPLPYGHQTLFMATRYWERSTPDDERITIEPDLVSELSSADYFAGRDPALETILNTPIAPG